jgi:hypothetical protein
LGIKLEHQFGEVIAGEFPLEGSGDALIIVLKLQETLLDLMERVEVVGSEDLALDNGEVDFDLVEPAGVDRGVDRDEVGEGILEATDGGLSAMGGAVVHDPEHSVRVAVRGLGHDLGDEAAKGLNAGGLIALSEDLGSMNIERGQVGPRSAAGVFMFDSRGLMRAGRQRGVLSDSGLNAGFLVGAEHEVLLSQRLALPLPGIEVEDAAGLLRKAGIAGEDPSAVLPGPDGVFMKPAPHGFITDRGDEAGVLDVADDIRGAQAGEWQTQLCRKLTRDGLDLHYDFWGEKPGAGPGVAVPPSPAIVRRRNVFAKG